MSKQVIIASNNVNKIKEFRAKLNTINPEFEVVTMAEAGFDIEIEEYGKTFYENALIKAQTIAKLYPEAIVIADDSGLEVNALDKAPGVYSARYAMEMDNYKNDKDGTNNQKLLANLKDVSDRSAQFKTVLCLIASDIEPCFVSGEVKGTILTEITGENGFGYDPLFTADNKRSFAQLTMDEKNKISHRACAIENLMNLPYWKQYV